MDLSCERLSFADALLADFEMNNAAGHVLVIESEEKTSSLG